MSFFCVSFFFTYVEEQSRTQENITRCKARISTRFWVRKRHLGDNWGNLTWAGYYLGEWFSLLFSCNPTPRTAAHQASLSFTISRSLLKLMSIESVMPSNHPVLRHPFPSCLQSFPASRSFPMSQLFTSGGQSIRVSALASVLPIVSKVMSLLFNKLSRLVIAFLPRSKCLLIS